MMNIDFDNFNDKSIYKAFGVSGREKEALNGCYSNLCELIGVEHMLKLFHNRRGEKVHYPKKLFRAEFIADLAAQTEDRRERARIARAGGYTAKFIDETINKRKKEGAKPQIPVLDFDDRNMESIYKAFHVEGQEEEALNAFYFSLYELVGKNAVLKMFDRCRGDDEHYPARLYRAEFIADLAAQTADKRERARIARAGGYTAKFIDETIHKRKKENEETEEENGRFKKR